MYSSPYTINVVDICGIRWPWLHPAYDWFNARGILRVELFRPVHFPRLGYQALWAQESVHRLIFSLSHIKFVLRWRGIFRSTSGKSRLESMGYYHDPALH